MKRNKFCSPNLLDRLSPAERRRRSAAIGMLLSILATVYFLLPASRPEALKNDESVAPPSQTDNQTVPLFEKLEEGSATVSLAKTVDLTLRNGDTLLGVLMQRGLKATAANDLIKKLQPFYNPRKMRAGDSFRLLLDHHGSEIQGLEHSVDGAIVRVISTDKGWVAQRYEVPFVRGTKVIRGNIRGSLFEDGVDAGLSPVQINNLADLFEYDIDFFSDLRRGDDFSVIFEEKQYANGQREKGKLLAAEIQAGGLPYQIFYFQGKKQKGSYYDNHGKALIKAFLRAPLNYSRISSPFRIHRRHPIFRTVRPHQAIDYAAPAGTPVIAVGHGRVTFAGTRGGYGQMVEIRHNNGYVSRYAHFAKIPKDIRIGKSITRGEVVGYVGQTGHATGPHLHFEMLNKGQKVNFLDLKIASADRLSGTELQEFLVMRDKKLSLLQGDAARASESPES
jgi:murein DD-endopeptidase MepM/ murein hydrolase activator NlpD